MRVPLVEYATLALSSGLGYSASGPPSVEVAPLGVADPTSTLNPSCWASSHGVSAQFGPIRDLHLNTNTFCNRFSTDNTGSTVISSGKLVFGWQSAMFVGNFASRDSCINSFTRVVVACYRTASPTHPVTLGGRIRDPGGANLVISFGDGAQL